MRISAFTRDDALASILAGTYPAAEVTRRATVAVTSRPDILVVDFGTHGLCGVALRVTRCAMKHQLAFTVALVSPRAVVELEDPPDLPAHAIVIRDAVAAGRLTDLRCCIEAGLSRWEPLRDHADRQRQGSGSRDRRDGQIRAIAGGVEA